MTLGRILGAGFLVTAIASSAWAQTPARSSYDAASDLARAGDHQRALALFEAIVAAEPANTDARIWVARLHLWTGNARLSESEFRSILTASPDNVDALVGLASAQLARGNATGAIAALTPAEPSSPKNADVLATLGRAHARAGHQTLAVSYLERAAALSPDRDTRMWLEDAQRARASRIEFGGFGERYNLGLSGSRSGDVTVSLRVSDALRVLGRTQAQWRFELKDGRTGGGLEWQSGATVVSAQYEKGWNNRLLPSHDAQFDVLHARGRAEFVGGYRDMTFDTAHISVLSPGLTYWWSDRVSTAVRYYLALTDFDSRNDLASTHSGTVRASYRLVPRIWLTGAYARGIENFETLSADRLGIFRANTYAAGTRVDLATLQTLSLLFEDQHRSDGAHMNRMTFSFTHRF